MDNTKEKVINAIAAYGADISSWPKGLTEKAAPLLKNDIEISTMLNHAQETDNLLKEYKIPNIPLENLSASIIERAKHTPQITATNKTHHNKRQTINVSFWNSLLPTQIFAPMGGLVAATVLGFWLSFSGTIVPPQTAQYQDLLLDPIFYKEITQDGNMDGDLLWYITEKGLEQ